MPDNKRILKKNSEEMTEHIAYGHTVLSTDDTPRFFDQGTSDLHTITKAEFASPLQQEVKEFITQTVPDETAKVSSTGALYSGGANNIGTSVEHGKLESETVTHKKVETNTQKLQELMDPGKIREAAQPWREGSVVRHLEEQLRTTRNAQGSVENILLQWSLDDNQQVRQAAANGNAENCSASSLMTGRPTMKKQNTRNREKIQYVNEDDAR